MNITSEWVLGVGVGRSGSTSKCRLDLDGLNGCKVEVGSWIARLAEAVVAEVGHVWVSLSCSVVAGVGI